MSRLRRRIGLGAALICLSVAPVEGARLITSGFEMNSVVAFMECDVVGGTPVVNATAKRSGSYGSHITGLATTTARFCRFQYRTTASADNTAYARTYVRVVTLPGTNDSTIACIGVSTCVAGVKLHDSGALELFDEDGTIGTTTATLSLNTWYCLELLLDGSPAAGSDVVTMRLGTEACGGDIETETSSARTIGGTFASFWVGGNLSTEANTTGEWYFDDVAVNDTSGSAQTDWPGQGAIVLLIPDGDGDTTNRGTQGVDWDTCTNNDAACGAGTGGTAYQMVDDATPPDEVSTHLRLMATSANCTDAPVLLFTVQSLTSKGVDGNDTITLVATRVRHGADASGNRTHRALMYSDTTCAQGAADITEGATIFEWDNSLLPFISQLVRYTDPDGDVAWTLAAVDAVQVGVRAGSDVSPQPQITAVYAEVEYVAVANVGAPNLLLLGVGQ